MNFLTQSNRIYLFLLLYPWIFLWQGIDFADLGIFARDYYTIQNAPEHTYLYCCYFTLIIGSLWDSAFNFLGYINFKIAYVFVLYLTMYMSYKVLSNYFKKEESLFGILIALIYGTTAFTKWVDYDNLTALFYLIAIFYGIRGVVKRNLKYMFIFGFFLGINIFVRVSNLAFLALFIPILYYLFYSKENIKRIVIVITVSFLGVISGAIIVLLLIKTLGHDMMFFESVGGMFKSSVDGSDYHHDLFSLLKKYLLDFIRFMILSMYYLTPLVIAFFSIKESHMPKIKVMFYSLLITIYLLFGYLLVSNILNGTSLVIENVQPVRIDFLLYLFAALIIFRKDVDIKIKTLVLFGIFILFLLAFGSAAGLYKQIYGIWLIVPVMFIFLFKLKNSSKSLKVKNIINIGLVSFIMASFMYSFLTRMEHRPNNALNMFYSIKHEKLNYIFTDKNRAKAMSELFIYTKKYIPKSSYLLMDGYSGDDGIYYITETIPYAKPYSARIQPYNKSIKNPFVIIHNKMTDTILRQYVKEKKYTKVFGNRLYQLWIPKDSE